MVLVLLAGVSASDVCEDTLGEVAQDDETGETLLCSDLVDLCTDDPEIAEICPKTCGKCGAEVPEAAAPASVGEGVEDPSDGAAIDADGSHGDDAPSTASSSPDIDPDIDLPSDAAEDAPTHVEIEPSKEAAPPENLATDANSSRARKLAPGGCSDHRGVVAMNGSSRRLPLAFTTVAHAD